MKKTDLTRCVSFCVLFSRFLVCSPPLLLPCFFFAHCCWTYWTSWNAGSLLDLLLYYCTTGPTTVLYCTYWALRLILTFDVGVALTWYRLGFRLSFACHWLDLGLAFVFGICHWRCLDLCWYSADVSYIIVLALSWRCVGVRLALTFVVALAISFCHWLEIGLHWIRISWRWFWRWVVFGVIRRGIVFPEAPTDKAWAICLGFKEEAALTVRWCPHYYSILIIPWFFVPGTKHYGGHPDLRVPCDKPKQALLLQYTSLLFVMAKISLLHWRDTHAGLTSLLPWTTANIILHFFQAVCRKKSWMPFVGGQVPQALSYPGRFDMGVPTAPHWCIL